MIHVSLILGCKSSPTLRLLLQKKVGAVSPLVELGDLCWRMGQFVAQHGRVMRGLEISLMILLNLHEALSVKPNPLTVLLHGSKTN
jgi:hypothetical protein